MTIEVAWGSKSDRLKVVEDHGKSKYQSKDLDEPIEIEFVHRPEKQ